MIIDIIRNWELVTILICMPSVIDLFLAEVAYESVSSIIERKRVALRKKLAINQIKKSHTLWALAIIYVFGGSYLRVYAAVSTEVR